MTQISGIALRAFLPLISDVAKSVDAEAILSVDNMTNIEIILTTVLVASTILLVAAIAVVIIHRGNETAKEEK